MKKIVIIGIVLLLVVAAVVVFWARKNLVSSLPYESLSDYAYESMIMSDGRRTNYRIQGNQDGPTVVLVHGGGGSLDDWQPWIERMQDHYRFVTVDLPGHGLTDQLAKEEMHSTRFGDFLNEFITKLELENFVIGGHSFGGESVLHYLTNYPVKAEGLILVASGGYRPDDALELEKDTMRRADSWPGNLILKYSGTRKEVEEGLQGYFHDQTKWNDALVDRYYRLGRYEKNRGTFGYLMVNMFKNYRENQSIGSIAIPTLILWGEIDKALDVSLGRRFHKDIANSQLIVYENVGHMIQFEHTEQSVEDVTKFIESLSD